MKAKKLPSGSWRCRATRNGVTRSFTVKDPTSRGKKECERIAAVWAASASLTPSQRTVEDAVEDYIERRSAALSVTTQAAYRSMLKNVFNFGNIEVGSLTDQDVQAWIDGMNKSPKYVANAYGLLSVAVGRFNVRLPSRRRKQYAVPTDEDIVAILRKVKGTDMEKAVLLAAFGTLREGEVCALSKKDVSGNTINVQRSLAWDGKGYVAKAPKTASSVRTVTLSDEIIAVVMSGDGEQIVNLTPKNLSNRFRRLMRAMDMPFRFHDLRAYSASVRHALGIPDQYIMAEGGWKTDSVMKAVYRRAMEDQRKKFNGIAVSHFEEVRGKIRGNEES